MTSKKTTKQAGQILHHEIAQLAHLNWERDGRPTGRDLQYWLEAEHQLKATKHLLVSESNQPPEEKTAAMKARIRRAPGNAAQRGQA